MALSNPDPTAAGAQQPNALANVTSNAAPSGPYSGPSTVAPVTTPVSATSSSYQDPNIVASSKAADGTQIYTYNGSQYTKNANGITYDPYAAPASATGSPVTATGQIAPPTPTPQFLPAPTPVSTAPNELRYVKPVDLSTVPNYNAATFTDPNATQANALTQSILQNPDTMNANVVAQMKEQQKEQALLMDQQNQQGITQNAVSRGAIGSGNVLGQQQNSLQAAINAILSGNRQTDITAASTNRQDEINALAAGTANSNTATNLQQANANQQYIAQQAAVQKLMDQFTVNQGVAQNAQGNYTADITNQMGQNSQMLSLAQFLENARQYNGQLGYDYNALGQAGNEFNTNLGATS